MPVFVEHRGVQAVLATALATLFGFCSEPPIINGETPGAKRHAIVDAFQAAPRGFDVLILSPKAAGVGLTITAVNHVIHLSRWWNPAVEDQCNDRVYRIGQTKPVTIHLPIARHPSYGAPLSTFRSMACLSASATSLFHLSVPPMQTPCSRPRSAQMALEPDPEDEEAHDGSDI